MINQKVRESRIENQHNYLYYVNLSPFLAKILKNLKNPEKVFQDFLLVSNNVYVCIYYILLLLLLLLYIYIRFPEFLSGPLSNGEKQSIFFSEGDPPFRFSGFYSNRA